VRHCCVSPQRGKRPASECGRCNART
jgi:hypothetical protein